jgi:hypothetical protein
LVGVYTGIRHAAICSAGFIPAAGARGHVRDKNPVNKPASAAMNATKNANNSRGAK